MCSQTQEARLNCCSPSKSTDLLDVTIANYNGTPHGGLAGRSPLEAMAYHIEKKRTELRMLAEPYRRNLCLLQPAHVSVIRGDVRRGVRPYINLYGIRYSSSVLGEATTQIGQPIRVFIDPEDMRAVMAFFSNGAEIGPLKAARPWDQTRHSLRLRQEILRLKRLKELDYGELRDPVETYFTHQRRQTKSKRRRATHRIAEAAQALEQRPQPTPLPSAAATTTKPAKPRELPIGKGQILR